MSPLSTMQVRSWTYLWPTFRVESAGCTGKSISASSSPPHVCSNLQVLHNQVLSARSKRTAGRWTTPWCMVHAYLLCGDVTSRWALPSHDHPGVKCRMNNINERKKMNKNSLKKTTEKEWKNKRNERNGKEKIEGRKKLGMMDEWMSMCPNFF